VGRDVLARLDARHGDVIRRVPGPKTSDTAPPPAAADDAQV
jgi:hypothetical protein